MPRRLVVYGAAPIGATMIDRSEVNRALAKAMPDDRTVAFFVNTDTGLIVVDVVDANEKGGREILRRIV